MTRVTSKKITGLHSSLDVIEHNRNSVCGRRSLRGHLDGRWHYRRLRCKCWRCECCGPRKAARLRRAIVRVATEKDLRRFLTLTLDPAACRPEDSIRYIRQCWNKFRTALKRQCGTSISFITILELQKSGYAHLHVLIDRYIPQGWISTAWQAVGGGRIVFIKQVDIHRVAPYLSKYLTKDLLLAAFRRRQRRYTTSRDITLLAYTSSGTWDLVKASLEYLAWKAKGAVATEHHDEHGVLEWFETLAPI